MRGPSRREIGHGNLAERALIPVLPDERRLPVRHPARVRVRDLERLDLDGLDLRLDARPHGRRRADHGARSPARRWASVSEPDGRFVVLTDILGKEDAFGDMDFKVTGTRDGITALQMDIKVKGINEAIIREGLAKALRGPARRSSTR